MRITSRIQAEAALRAIAEIRGQIAALRQSTGNLGFSVTNVAIDEKARNPAHRIYYYNAVDTGRVAITAGANRTNAYPQLHFMTAEGDWIVTRRVRAATPRGIGTAAQQLITPALAEVRQSLAGVTNPAEVVRLTYERSKTAIISAYRQATIDRVTEQNTKLRYGITDAIPLAEGFRIVQGGRVEEP